MPTPEQGAGAKKWHRNYPASRRTGRLSDDDSAAQVNRRGDARTDEALCPLSLSPRKLRHVLGQTTEVGATLALLSLAMDLRALVRQTTRAKPKRVLQWW